jgi:Zn-dependent peptidase ImmA (M78 family)/transcriptional regulator with XRE-family HTH domain
MNLSGEHFHGERLQLAREFRSLTQKELAEKICASHALISQYESGKKRSPSPLLVSSLVDELGFSEEFFYRKIEDSFLPHECSFRHRRAAAEKLKTRIRAHATLLGMVVGKLRNYFKFPALDLPSYPAQSDFEIESAAEATRHHWKLGIDAPLKYVGRVLENAGVIIVPHLVATTKVDAFSRQGQTTLIFLNEAIQSTSRWIFDIGHECGHLVMHAGLPTGTVETEQAADRFASAFLMPRNAFSRDFGSQRGSVSFKRIFDLKRHWRTSAAAIVRRAYDLDLITAVDYRRAYQYMSLKGWRSAGEPYEPEFQKPELLRAAINALGPECGLTMNQLCMDLHFTPSTFRAVTNIEAPTEQANTLSIVATRRGGSSGGAI